ncbi:TetR/AcrR family transcriptional regulator, partial [Kibdelosporangium lantanae]
RATELPAVEIRRLTDSLTSFVRGHAQAFAETREAAKATGMSEEEWWTIRSALVDEYAPDFGERFPNVTAIERAGAYVPTSETTPYLEQQALEAFQAGLPVFLDGIERAVAQPADRP